MLSTFSEVDAAQFDERVALEVGQRLKASARYPAWLDGLTAASGHAPVPLAASTWVVANDADLAAIARAARSASHPAELHHGAAVDGPRFPAYRGPPAVPGGTTGRGRMWTIAGGWRS
ncbi:hypothetical protein AB0F15_40630 [Amycolatopsis sp. NPDC026612]|uniref:hypothetical protein n=1 Tax=Amycolatopsis sp. NPDC026612 TaxID=3155466 RepID=UPI0033F91E3F